MSQLRTGHSPSTFVNCVPDFLICKRLESLSLRDFLAKRPKICNGSAHILQRLASFRYNPGYRFVVPRDHNLLTARYAVQKFSKAGFCLKGGDRTHGCSPKMTSQ